MKIAHLSVGDPFTSRWVNAQAAEGYNVHLIMLQPAEEEIKGSSIYILPFKKPFGYFLNVFHLRRLLRKIQPDLLHVHYATGNGTLGRLSGFHPSILSVWGSDVMVTPFSSAIMRRIVIKNLAFYDWICSTSKVMADDTLKLCPRIKNLSLTPIGVDTCLFAPNPKAADGRSITIGTVKTLDDIYGIDILLKAFVEARHLLRSKNPGIADKMKLFIAGGGPHRARLQRLAVRLHIDDVTCFAGQIANTKVSECLNQMDIFVAMSRLESFGVAVIEASACALPVVVSNVGGLKEVVLDGVTGYIVESENVHGAASRIVDLILNPDKGRKMGKAGRLFVQQRYEWQHCMSLMNDVYEKTLVLNNGNNR